MTSIRDRPGFQGLRVFAIWLLGGMAGAWTMHILWSIDVGRSIAPGLLGLAATAFTTAGTAITLIAVDRKRRGRDERAQVSAGSPPGASVTGAPPAVPAHAPPRAIAGRPDDLAFDPREQGVPVSVRGVDDTPDDAGARRT